MVTVYTKKELESALSQHKGKILCKGEIARQVREKYEKKKKLKTGGALIGGALAIGGIVALPFTGGASAALSATGLSAMGLTIGGLTISAVELAMICGTTLGAIEMIKKAKVTIRPDGGVEIDVEK